MRGPGLMLIHRQGFDPALAQLLMFECQIIVLIKLVCKPYFNKREDQLICLLLAHDFAAETNGAGDRLKEPSQHRANIV